VAEFHKLLARLKSALEMPKARAPHQDHVPEPVPVSFAAQRAELAARFAHELGAVGGHFIGTLDAGAAADRVAALAREAGVRRAAVGEGVVTEMHLFTRALEGAGCEVIRPARVADGERAAMRERLAQCDLGVAEAHYAIASTGTFAVLTAEARPNSLTLLPPLSVIIAHVDRLIPDLALTLAAFGAETIAAHRVSLITGPSRTADIEKRIVLGVHGPKQLYGAIIWPNHE
jgi:L-lactate dehydrogenase complex protein LldG